MSRLRMHLNARLFSPDDVRPRSVENLSLGGSSVCGAGSEWIWTNPWCDENMADIVGLASDQLYQYDGLPDDMTFVRTGESCERDRCVREPTELLYPSGPPKRLLT